MARSVPRNIWYTVYRANDDTILAYGCSDTCAYMLDITLAGFRSVVSRVKTGSDAAYTIVREDLDNGDYRVYGADNRGKPRAKNGATAKVRPTKQQEAWQTEKG